MLPPHVTRQELINYLQPVMYGYQDDPPAITGFLDRDYRHKSVNQIFLQLLIDTDFKDWPIINHPLSRTSAASRRKVQSIVP